MQSYPIALSAAMSATSLANDANFFVYESSTSPGEARIIVMPENGAEIILKPGQAIRIAGHCSRWFIRSFDGVSTVTGVVILGDGDFRDSGVVGTVAVVDGGKARTLAGVAFMGASGSGAGVAAQYPHVQLWNPVGSGKRIMVKQVVLSVEAVAQQIGLVTATSALSAFVMNPASKMLGGAASSAQMRYGSDVALLGNVGILQPYMGANSNMIFSFTEPLVILPGNGINLRGIAQSSVIGLAVEIYEEVL